MLGKSEVRCSSIADVLRVCRQHVSLHIHDPDLRAANAGRLPVRDLRRQLQALSPHGTLPCVERAVPPIFGEVGFRDLGQ